MTVPASVRSLASLSVVITLCACIDGSTVTPPSLVDADLNGANEGHATDADAEATAPVAPSTDGGALDGSLGAADAGHTVGADASVMDARVDADADAVIATDASTDAAVTADGGPFATDASEARHIDASAVHVEQLIDPQAIPISERGFYTDNGRFFVIGGYVLYEIVAQGQGFKAVELLRETCTMGGAIDHGNLIYISCMYDTDGKDPDLLRVDPTVSGPPMVQRAALPGIATPVLVNGMEFGPDGALYFSNSGSLLSGAPALYRVKITGDAPFTVQLSPIADGDAIGGATAPNGIRFDGNMMYVSNGNALVRIELGADGGLGAPQEVFTIPLGYGVVDDLDIAEKQLFIAETDSADVLTVTALGADAGSPFGSPLVVTTLDGKVELEFDLSFIPSGTAVRRDTLFGEASVIVTSYFNGGLYRVTGAY